VLHAPSRRWTKGTDLFLPALEKLEAQGAIELRLAEGLSRKKMREQVQDADIVVDQVVLGSYDSFACEAMAAGKPVVAFLSDVVAEVVGEVPPIANATPDEVAGTVEELVADRARAARLGAEALSYVRRHHDGSETVRRLNEHFLDA
jgi:glycosyltransferase involved in cell wall biosynthesis